MVVEKIRTLRFVGSQIAFRRRNIGSLLLFIGEMMGRQGQDDLGRFQNRFPALACWNVEFLTKYQYQDFDV
jgi:hypothetical protein